MMNIDELFSIFFVEIFLAIFFMFLLLQLISIGYQGYSFEDLIIIFHYYFQDQMIFIFILSLLLRYYLSFLIGMSLLMVELLLAFSQLLFYPAVELLFSIFNYFFYFNLNFSMAHFYFLIQVQSFIHQFFFNQLN